MQRNTHLITHNQTSENERQRKIFKASERNTGEQKFKRQRISHKKPQMPEESASYFQVLKKRTVNQEFYIHQTFFGIEDEIKTIQMKGS